jgi:hypothetical protein
MLHVVLDWKKIYKSVLEKAFFFSLWCFNLFWFLCQKLLKMALLRGDNFCP